MAIDYAGLYAHDYFGHQPGATSFQASFPAMLIALTRELGCAGVLDVGSGNGELARTIVDAGGLHAVSLDLRGDEAAGVLPFNLTEQGKAQIDSTRSTMLPKLHGLPYLTTCLDVLEHIDRCDLAAALWNLRELTGEWLLVSVSTRPSSRDNLFHATVIPRRTWRRLFEAAGFAVEEHPGTEPMSYHLTYPPAEEFWGMRQWRHLNPFGDSTGREPYYLLLHRQPGKLAIETISARAKEILYLPELSGSNHPNLHPETHISFIIGHYQDFHHYRPFFEALDRRSVTVLIRSGPIQWIDERRYRAIIAYLRSHGLRYHEVQSAGEVNWHDTPGSRRAVVIATESTALDTHLVNAAFVLAAQRAGCRTFQLQHGIWPHADFPAPVAFASQHVLAWANEVEEEFVGHASPADRFLRPEGTLGRPRFSLTGCPKFDELADPRPITPADLLGDWAEAYSQSVLIGTNLNWWQHRRGAEVVPALVAMAERRPDTLFLCKLHPVHDFEGVFPCELPPNFRVLDEFACLFADLSTPRLVRACDATIGTFSTIMLEAALADRPLRVMDTANPNGYVGVKPVSVQELDAAVASLLDVGNRSDNLAKHRSFRDHYFDRSLLGRGLCRVLEVIEDDLENPSTMASSTDPPLVVAESFSAALSRHYTKAGRNQLAELAAQLLESQSQLRSLQAQQVQCKDAYREELANVRQMHEAQREERYAGHCEELANVRQMHEAQREELDARHREELANIRQMHETQCELNDARHREELTRARQLYHVQSERSDARHHAEVANSRQLYRALESMLHLTQQRSRALEHELTRFVGLGSGAIAVARQIEVFSQRFPRISPVLGKVCRQLASVLPR